METLTSLDKRIIRRLFSFLPLSEKLKLALVHASFGDVLKNTIDCELLTPLDIQTNFSVNEVNYLLSTFGAFIKRYEHIFRSDDASADEYFKLIRTYCTNLEEITLHASEITPNNHEGQLLAQSKQLKTLKLKGCTVGNAACSLLLAGLSKLQSLNVENSKVTGKGLGALTNLIDLNLKNCRNFKCAHLIDIFKRNRLKSLNIVGFKQITTRTLDVLIETQSELEKLTLGTKYWSKNFERICTLKNVREVSMINMIEDPVVDYLKVLVAEKKDSLECLEVYLRIGYTDHEPYFPETHIVNRICELHNLRILSFRNCSIFDNRHLVYVGKACRRLEMLDLSGSSFTDVAVAGCLEYLKCLRHLDISYCPVKKNLYLRLAALRREMGFSEPLVIYIKSEMEIASILKSEEYLPDENRVWLSLNSMRPNYEDSLLDRLVHLNLLHQTKSKPAKYAMASKISNSPEHCLLLRLDDYCLYHIIQYLSPVEKLNLLLANERFVDIVKYFLRTDIIHSRALLQNFTLRDARRLLARYGSLIRRLHISFAYGHLNLECLDLIAEFCTNLVELNYMSVPENDKLNRILNASANTLENFGMTNCEVPDAFSLEIVKARKLHTLTLDNVPISGVHLDKLTNLTKLHFHDCEAFEHLIEICRSNRLLELDIEGCTKLNKDAFRVLGETQKNLKRISLKGIYAAMNMYALADLTSLEHIKLVNCQPQESLQFLDGVCEHRSGQIKSLQFHYDEEFPASLRLQLRQIIMKMTNLRILRVYHTGVSDEDIKCIVDACSQLEILDIAYGTEPTEAGLIYPLMRLRGLLHYNILGCSVDDKFAFYRKAVKIRMENFPDRSMTLHASLDMIIDALKNTREYAAMEKYVDVTDDMPDSLIQGLPQKTTPKSYHAINTVHMTDDPRTAFNIVDLPDKCLLKVASYLEPVDRLKLASLHGRFLNSIRSLIDGMTFDLNVISKSFTVLEAKNLFQACNNLIQRIQFASGYFEYLKLLQPYSEHLVEIYIEGRSFMDSEGCIEKFLASPLKKLEKLVLENCGFTNLLSKLSNKSQLRYLKTSEWPSSESEPMVDMKEFSNLKELYLEDCWTFNETHLKEICANCKLKVLDLREAIYVSAEVMQILLETQNDCLEHLAISDLGETKFSDDVARLGSLKHVVVQFDDFNWTRNAERFIDKLIVYHSNDLLTLKVICLANFQVDYSWFQMIETKRCKFQKLKLFQIVVKGPYVKNY